MYSVPHTYICPLPRIRKPTILAISVNRVRHPNINERPIHLPISGNMSPISIYAHLQLISSSSPAHLQPIHVPKSHPVHSPRPFQSIAQCPQPPSHSSTSKEKLPIRLHHRLQPMLPPPILIRNTRDVDPQLIIITTIPAALAIFPEPPVTSLADLYLTAVIRTALCAVVVHAAVAAQSVVVC